MKKKLNLFVIIISVLIITSACSKKEEPEKTVPEEIVIEETVPDTSVIDFMASAKKFDIEEMISKIDPQNRDGIDDISKLYEEGQKQENIYILNYFKDNAKDITYKINDTTISGDTAVVSVDVNYIDGTPLFRSVMSDYTKKVLASKFTGQELTQDQSVEIIISSMKKHEQSIGRPVVNKQIDIRCVKIDGEWYIEELTENLSNVVTSNILSAIEKIEESLNSSFGK